MDQNEIIITVIAGTILFASLIVFISLFIQQYYRAQKNFRLERLIYKHKLLQTEVEIREQTLEQISGELHDNLGQIASVLKINLNLLRTDLDENQKQRLDESLDLLKRMIADIKHLSLGLNKDFIVRNGLIDSMKNDISHLQKSNFIAIEIFESGERQNMKPEYELILYRMCQEILNNILKHSNASYAEFYFRFSPDLLHIQIKDDGIGFQTEDYTSVNKPLKGSGINNLRKRTKILGGNIDIRSRPGEGTEIHITIPLNKNFEN